jgi:hypothetical protein
METLLEIGKILAVMVPLSGVIAWFLSKILSNISESIQELKASMIALFDKLSDLATDFAELKGEHTRNHKE